MAGGCGKGSLFGETNGVIKYQGGDMVAIEGANIMERLLLSGVAIPYKQILKGRIMLKAGETNYLMNHLGLGNNATLVSMVVKYDPKSKLEIDNYIEYEYVDNMGIKRPIAQILTLNGNSTHRIPQLILSNPNIKYGVSIDVMVAVVDNASSEYSLNIPVITFINLVSRYDGGIIQPGTPSTDTSNSFYASFNQDSALLLDVTTLIMSVYDDIDTIANSDVKFEGNGYVKGQIGITETTIFTVSVMDSSFNITAVSLKIEII